MATETGRYILRNAAIWLDRVSQLGEAMEIELPEIKIISDKYRAAGTRRATEVNLGAEAMTTKIKKSSLDPTTLKLFGVKIGKTVSIMATAALVDEDGSGHTAIATLTGKLHEAKFAPWKAADKIGDNDYTFATDYFKLEIDGEVVAEESLAETDDIRRLLLLQ